MGEIAKRDGVGKQYVSRLIRLAFLAPEMVERIVAGRRAYRASTTDGRFDIPAGWAAQSVRSDFASRLNLAPIKRTGNNILLFNVKRQVRRQAKSTAKSANREKSQNSRLNPDETSSPVDHECRIPAKCAFFRAGEEENPEN